MREGGSINLKFYAIIFFLFENKYLYTYISYVGLHLSTRLFLLPCHAGSRMSRKVAKLWLAWARGVPGQHLLQRFLTEL